MKVQKSYKVTSVAQVQLQGIADQYHSRIYRAALVLTGNPWDADDLTQETFLVLSRQHHRFRGSSSIYTWLYGILLNHERSHRRRWSRRHHKLRMLWDTGSGLRRTFPAAEAPIEVDEWKQSLWCRVAELPDGQRHALVLRFSAQLRYDEIAEVLGCPLGTVKSRISNGLAALRETFQAQDADECQSPDLLNEGIRYVG